MDHNKNDDENKNENDENTNVVDVCDDTDHNDDIFHNMFYICMLNMKNKSMTTNPYNI